MTATLASAHDAGPPLGASAVPADAVLTVESLVVRFGGVTAVDDVTFDVGRGTILGLVGPNGAGKTTIFDALGGFVASRGHISLEGVEISGKSPERRARARLGRSFQDARLFPSLTVSEALAIAFERHIRAHDLVSTALSLPWVRKSEKRVRLRVEELIELMGLGAFRDKFVSELSTGSRRIVDLAAIIAHDPVVLLLDEPSSGIAQREAEALGPLLLKIRQETGTTMLVIEHDMPLISSVSDEILALETGAILTRGPADEVLRDPRLVAAYLGTNQAVVARSGRQAGPDAAPRRPRRPRVAPPAEAAVAPLATNGPAAAAAATSTPPRPRTKAAPAKTTSTAKKAAPAKSTTKAATTVAKKTAAVKKVATTKATAKKTATVKKATSAKKKA